MATNPTGLDPTSGGGGLPFPNPSTTPGLGQLPSSVGGINPGTLNTIGNLVGAGATLGAGALTSGPQVTNYNQQGTQTSTPNIPGNVQPLQTAILQSAQAGLSPTNLQGYTGSGLQNIAQQGQTNQNIINQILAQRGLTPSANLASALSTSNALNTGNEMTQFRNNIPLIQQQLLQNNLAGAVNAFRANPFGTTGTNSITGSRTTNQPGGQLGGLLQALAALNNMKTGGAGGVGTGGGAAGAGGGLGGLLGQLASLINGPSANGTTINNNPYGTGSVANTGGYTSSVGTPSGNVSAGGSPVTDLPTPAGSSPGGTLMTGGNLNYGGAGGSFDPTGILNQYGTVPTQSPSTITSPPPDISGIGTYDPFASGGYFGSSGIGGYSSD